MLDFCQNLALLQFQYENGQGQNKQGIRDSVFLCHGEVQLSCYSNTRSATSQKISAFLSTFIPHMFLPCMKRDYCSLRIIGPSIQVGIVRDLSILQQQKIIFEHGRNILVSYYLTVAENYFRTTWKKCPRRR